MSIASRAAVDERTPAIRLRSSGTIAALSALYVSQGIPFGFASEYLPVVLREQGYSLTAVAAIGWLQLPWQLKVFWASLADTPSARRHGARVLLGLQAALALTIALFGIVPFASAPRLWFALTLLAAFVAATQDIFVDALAVRALAPSQRGLGNSAQVAGYRFGLLVGGAGLLLLAARIGSRAAVLACASIVALSSIASLSLARTCTDALALPHAQQPLTSRARARIRALLAHAFSRGAWRVIAMAFTFKLGLHMAGVLLKPMAVDAHWTREQIGWAIVTAGTGCGLAGSLVGGLVHTHVRESRALAFAALAQALVCLPLVIALRSGVPYVSTTLAIAAEHFASGLGTTVLFAALMSATRPADAGFHYTALTSANALCIGVGGMLGGALGDALGKDAVFALAALVSLAPIALLRGWASAAKASAS